MLLLNQSPINETELLTATELDIRNIAAKDWPTVLRATQVRHLRLYHITAPELPDFSPLHSLRHLSLDWAGKITDLSPLFQLNDLQTLEIINFPKLRNLDGIGSMSSLTTLHLSGNHGSCTPPLRLDSIAPVAELPNLTDFSLANAKLADDDITILAQCRGLHRLHLSNQFEKQQFAYLAKHLNSQLDTPIAALWESSLHCQRCGLALYMVIGRRGRFLCRRCDAKHVAKAEAVFANMMASV
ncbi:leucine-rich repeat domain-containing protein [Eikenella sp. S3360]|uniref:Leucine-rich repeat domain-containing protein n=1 Tax=Eikenella glucosivorans TaxID=2766967 RepID=A0ABS0N7G8_9NEIS|nr:hypothetical protein [Eikenella glucosivorans]MBH5328235.1 leucine-rich repeat domain-containing protein [Eikenella glucosivorans]